MTNFLSVLRILTETLKEKIQKHCMEEKKKKKNLIKDCLSFSFFVDKKRHQNKVKKKTLSHTHVSQSHIHTQHQI